MADVTFTCTAPARHERGGWSVHFYDPDWGNRDTSLIAQMVRQQSGWERTTAIQKAVSDWCEENQFRAVITV